MKTTYLTLTAASALIATAGLASAEENAGTEQKAAKPMPIAQSSTSNDEMTAFDENEDGKISKAEFKKYSDMKWSKLDLNDDGEVTQEEIAEARENVTTDNSATSETLEKNNRPN